MEIGPPIPHHVKKDSKEEAQQRALAVLAEDKERDRVLVVRAALEGLVVANSAEKTSREVK